MNRKFITAGIVVILALVVNTLAFELNTLETAAPDAYTLSVEQVDVDVDSVKIRPSNGGDTMIVKISMSQLVDATDYSVALELTDASDEFIDLISSTTGITSTGTGTQAGNDNLAEGYIEGLFTSQGISDTITFRINQAEIYTETEGILIMISYGDTVITSYWSLNGIDQTDGTLNGATETTGVNGVGLEFDGVYNNLYVDDKNGLDLTTTGTLEAWVKANTHKDYAGIIHKGELADFSDESYSLQFWNSNGQIRFGLFDGSGGYIVLDSNQLLNTGQWHHVVGTWNSTHLCIYIDGTLDNYMTNTFGAAIPSDGGLVIGAQLTEDYNSSLKRFGFDGVVDEVAIYSTCLTPSQIQQRYEGLNPY